MNRITPITAAPVGAAVSPAAAPANPYTYEHVGLDDYVSRACPDCEGTGEVELLALDATRPAIVGCDKCAGTGKVAVYCQCGEPVTGGAPDGDNGCCHACELIFHRDAREPTDDEIYAGWATAERYALQFRGGEAAHG